MLYIARWNYVWKRHGPTHPPEAWELEGNGLAIRMHLKHVFLGILSTPSWDLSLSLSLRWLGNKLSFSTHCKGPLETTCRFLGVSVPKSQNQKPKTYAKVSTTSSQMISLVSSQYTMTHINDVVMVMIIRWTMHTPWNAPTLNTYTLITSFHTTPCHKSERDASSWS